MLFQIGDRFIPDRHLRLASYLSIARRRYKNAGLLDVNRCDSPITQYFQTSQELLRNGALDLAELKIMNLLAKYMEFRDVEKYAPQLVSRFKQRLRTNRFDDYLGVQCELAVASSLLTKNFQFTCPDPPDFQINTDGSTQAAFIECTSVHVSADSDRDLSYKIGSAINSKRRKGYCKSETGLVIDVTNVMYHSLSSASPLDPTDIKDRFCDLAANSGFGAVLIICELGDVDSRCFKTMYQHLSIKNPSPELQTVLDHCFPNGKYSVPNAVVPQAS